MNTARKKTKKGHAAARKRGEPGARRLGRRPGNHSTRETVLDAAEELFAGKGFAAASLRAIAARAQVNEALVHHYFKSKDGLFRAVFLRRGQELARERLELLDLVESRPVPPTLEEVLRAWLIPALNMRRRHAGGVAFLRIAARLEMESSPTTLELRTLVYQESMQRFADAFKRALPNLEPKTVFWRMVFLIGTFLFTVSESHRISVLSNGLCNPQDTDEVMAQLIPFLLGGMERNP